MLLAQISPAELTDSHLQWLVKMCRVDFTGAEPKHYIADALDGKIQFWDFKHGQGLLMTQILNHPGGKELFILGLAGEGLVKEFKRLNDVLQQYAVFINARWIGGNVSNLRLVPLYEKLMGKKFSVRCAREV